MNHFVSTALHRPALKPSQHHIHIIGSPFSLFWETGQVAFTACFDKRR